MIAAAAAWLVSGAVAAPAQATAYGYGDFLGTYYRASQFGEVGNYTIDDVYNLLNAAPVADPNVSGVNTGGLGIDASLLVPFNSAGKCDAGVGVVCPEGSGFLSIVNNADALLSGTWQYSGNTGFEPVDLYLLVKYDNAFSIFHYGAPGINFGDTGLFSSSAAILAAAGVLNAAGTGPVGTCDESAWQYESAPDKKGKTKTLTADGLRDCIKQQGSNPHAVSHIEGYWPALNPVPLPPAMILMVSGVVGMVAFARRSRKGATPVASA